MHWILKQFWHASARPQALSRRVAVHLSLLACLYGGLRDARAEEATPQVSLVSISARLFLNRTGSLSADVLKDEKIELRNRIAGDDATDAVLVVVGVSAPTNAVPGGAP